MDKETLYAYREWLLSLINYALTQWGFKPIQLKPKNKLTVPKEYLPTQYLLIKDENSDKAYEHYRELGLNPLHLSPQDLDSLNKHWLYIVLGQYEENIHHLQWLRHHNIKALWDQTGMKADNQKPIWKRRVSVMEAIYSDLMTEKIECRESVVLTEKTEGIDFEHQIFNNYLERKEDYRQMAQMYLKRGWDLNRMNPITLAIILEAMAEHDSLKTEPPILITEAIKTAKNYCGEEDYKIINGMLDSYFKSLES